MQLTAEVKKGDKYFVARCPELGVTTQGRTEQEAKENLREAVELHLESISEIIIQ